MKKFKGKFLVLFFVFASLSVRAQTAYDIDHTIGIIIGVSFRLGDNDKHFVDSLQLIAQKAGNKKLLAYSNFINKAWHLAFTAETVTERKKLEQEVDHIAESSEYIDLRGHALLWKAKGLLFGKTYNSNDLYLALKGKKLLEEVHYENYPYSIYYYFFFMEIYSRFEDFNNAIRYCKLSLQQPPTRYIGIHSQYNDLGTFYIRLGYYDSAWVAFNKAIVASRKAGIPSFEAMARGNLGNVLRLKKQYRQALPYLYEAISKTENDIPEIAALSRIYVANCFLQLDSAAKALPYLKFPAFLIPIWAQPNFNYNWFETMAMYYAKTGNFQAAIVYKDSLIALKDSIRFTKDSKKIIEQESTLQAQQFANEREGLEKKESLEKWKRNIIIIGLMLLLAAVLYLFNQRRKKASQMLAIANEQLDQYLFSIKEKNDLIDLISQKLQENTLVMTEEEKKNYIEILEQSILLTEENWAEFKTIFEQVFPDFFKLLTKKYPSLTAAETRLLALEQLNLPDKNMGNMLGISADSVRKTRYRLVKKYPELRGNKDEAEGGE
jgi:tetratricopeptide (TPR) repeat protein